MTTAIYTSFNQLLHDSSSTSPRVSQGKLQESLQDRFGLKVAAQLSLGNATLSHDISERLRVARLQAVVKRKRAPQTVTQHASASAVYGSGGLASMGFGDLGDDKLNLWNRIASMLPLIVLVVGLITISLVQNDQRAQELADVDVALLTDDLPPSAYADPGFAQFLIMDAQAPNESAAKQ